MSGKAPKGRNIHCAVYTRKSSDNGLEKAFNSLEAQRESGEAYIKSQKHEGWVLIKENYDDGGFSGGNTDRPALTRLLEDIRAGLVNVVVVYKVDRLTRSLADFAKLVVLFDSHGVSFVSVTQQFNTTTSMGRLTLNVLLSFAQFEREVTGERIRDKFEASRRKGMWMGGHPPLGYDIVERKLVINKAEAKVVRHIFTRYLELGGVKALKDELERKGYRSKQWTSSSNRTYGGKPFKRGALYYILKNRLYIGEAVHKGTAHPGEHDPIITVDLWDKVQAHLAEKAAHHEKGINNRYPSLLRGLLFDGQGNHMSPSHANKRGKRYRYYVSQALTQHRAKEAGPVTRIPAYDIERLVMEQVERVLFNPGPEILNGRSGGEETEGVAGELEKDWAKLDLNRRSEITRVVVRRVTVLPREVAIEISRSAVIAVLDKRLCDGEEDDHIKSDDAGDDDQMTLTIPATLKKNGSEKIIETPSHIQTETVQSPNPDLIRCIARAHHWVRKLTSGEIESVKAIANQAGMNHKYVARTLKTAFLAPDITEAILHGRQPPDLTVIDILKPFPMTWDEQRTHFGFA